MVIILQRNTVSPSFQQDNESNSKLLGMNCGDSNNFGTNPRHSDFSFVWSDNTTV